jgi:hypothetical protein
LYGSKLGKHAKKDSSKQSSSMATLAASDKRGLSPSGNFFLSAHVSAISRAQTVKLTFLGGFTQRMERHYQPGVVIWERRQMLFS